MQHHLRHPAGQEDLHGGKAARAIRQRIHQPRNTSIDMRPIFRRRAIQAGGMGDSRHVQQQIRRAAERGMNHHRVR